MIRRRHREEEESSLELLLDTMCNTFGGVMFIAIALFIIISAFPPEKFKNDTPPVKMLDPEKLEQEIVSLRAMLEAKRQERQLLEADLKRKQESPLQRKMQEIVLLERLIHEEELAARTRKLELEKCAVELQNAAENLEKLEKLLRDSEAKKRELEETKEQLETELAELKARPAERVSMEFKVMEASQKRPFFIILDGTSAWPVGPWRSPEGEDKPDAAVQSAESISDGLLTVRCKIVPDKGIPVLADNQMSVEFQSLLRKIPADQVPKFFIHPSAAATVSRLREILKERNILHGCTPAEDDAQELIYNYQKVVRYEY